MLKVRCKVWLERDGRAVFGEGRARLLEAIAASGSLSAAARALRIPYRTAWQHVNAMEKGYGKKILRRQVGGAAGGGCRLTPAGAALLRGYQAIHEGLDGLLDQLRQRGWRAVRVQVVAEVLHPRDPPALPPVDRPLNRQQFLSHKVFDLHRRPSPCPLASMG